MEHFFNWKNCRKLNLLPIGTTCFKFILVEPDFVLNGAYGCSQLLAMVLDQALTSGHVVAHCWKQRRYCVFPLLALWPHCGLLMLKSLKLTAFTLAEKAEIIKTVSCGKLSKTAARKEYGILKNTQSCMLLSEDTFLAPGGKNVFKSSCRRTCTAQHVNLWKNLFL